MKTSLNKIKRLIPRRLFTVLQPIYHFLMAWIASLVYRFPSDRLIVIGVTGTTGKTTSVYLIAKTLEECGYKTGFTSTAMFNNGEKEWLNDKKMTMVGRLFTQKMLSEMVKNGCRFAIIETTSEGIRQFRHRFINYDILVITGLYPEHIDSHGSFDKYKAAKGELFRHLSNCHSKYANDEKFVISSPSGLRKTELNHIKKTIIANLDDEHAGYFLEFSAERKIGFLNIDGLDSDQAKSIKKDWEEKNVEVVDYGKIKMDTRGTSFEAAKTSFNMHLLGEFNVANAMTAVCTALSQNLALDKIREGLAGIKGVAGRLERIDEGQDFAVIVDYAFEPNAITKLYDTVSRIPHNKIIHILGGTGGGRDASRRPINGKIAGMKSDIVIVTNEDPYDEDPQIIIDQVAIGAEHAGKIKDKDLFIISDRGQAIERGIKMAGPGDIVLITGKGSEQYMCIANGEMIPWDDRAVARGILSSDDLKAKIK